MGFVVGKEGQLQVYVDFVGNIFYVDKDDIEECCEVIMLIMLSGFLDLMNVNEI